MSLPNCARCRCLCREWCGTEDEWLPVMHVHEDSACERQDLASRRHGRKHMVVPPTSQYSIHSMGDIVLRIKCTAYCITPGYSHYHALPPHIPASSRLSHLTFRTKERSSPAMHAPVVEFRRGRCLYPPAMLKQRKAQECVQKKDVLGVMRFASGTEDGGNGVCVNRCQYYNFFCD